MIDANTNVNDNVFTDADVLSRKMYFSIIYLFIIMFNMLYPNE